MIGRMARSEQYKGHASIIEAWPRVLRQKPDAELWIVGEGDLRSELQERSRHTGAGQRIRFFGTVSEEQKRDLLQRSRCLALPSRGEGFGLVYVEAMAQGRPCLVSTADAGREVVNPPDAGLSADPDDPEVICSALCRLLTEGEEWDRWSANAILRYRRHYTEQAFQTRLLAALSQEITA
jgi:phosphatidylinositol alpha-1,6-mannosyltransferase